MLSVLLSASLASCGSIGSGKVVIAKNPPKKVLDSNLRKLCNETVVLPERELSQEETEAFWSVDRRSLVDCGSRFKKVIELKGNE